MAARDDLVKFYFARAMYPEARGILNVMVGATPVGDEDAQMLMLHAAASTLMGRPEQALKVIATRRLRQHRTRNSGPALRSRSRANGRWRAKSSRNSGFALASLPFDLQRIGIVAGDARVA